MACAHIARLIRTSKAILTNRKWHARTLRPLKKAEAGELVLLSQDEARFSLVPTLRTTLGVKGHRPMVGNLDCHEYLYLFGALNLVSSPLTTRLVERPTTSKMHRDAKHRYLQEAFARHLPLE